MVLNQFGAMSGAGIAIDGVAFNQATDHREPSSVDYQGPTRKRRVSGAPVLQGPVVWTLKWHTMTLDDYQTLYTIWNLKINPNGASVQFGINDPRQAGSFSTAAFWMDEPTCTMSDLFVRDVTVVMTEVIA